MRILIYVPASILKGSGGAMHLRELVENLSNLGSKVAIVPGLRRLN
ncbi:MAG: hypothetical protein KAV98_05800 [Dehalococcoidia bacterium]|nr:hypothetical protein [Dehalococcoidia bacterium]